MLRRCAELTAEAMPRLRSMKDLAEYWVEINRLENEADRSYRKLLAEMFRGGMDPMDVLRAQGRRGRARGRGGRLRERGEPGRDDRAQGVLSPGGDRARRRRRAFALGFDYTNGFHDAANAIATSVSTRALTPRVALLMAAAFNLLGALLGTEVARPSAAASST